METAMGDTNLAIDETWDGACSCDDSPQRRYNAETLAAIDEARRMTDDPTLGHRYRDIDEWRAELYADV
jgi:hypothetical protein